LLGHQTPLWGEHSRLNECPVSLDHYRTTAMAGYIYRNETSSNSLASTVSDLNLGAGVADSGAAHCYLLEPNI
ncbi:hypothetical protein, partial [Pseudomonas helleri]|uniref:hypothetical protein n=1 Tax=Pseudomonas helleri TaxID=1608996 RepID=UPI001E45B821